MPVFDVSVIRTWNMRLTAENEEDAKREAIQEADSTKSDFEDAFADRAPETEQV